MAVNVAPIVGLATLIVGAFMLLDLLTGGGRVRKALRLPERESLGDAAGQMIAALIIMAVGLWVVKDNLTGNAESAGMVIGGIKDIWRIFFPAQ